MWTLCLVESTLTVGRVNLIGWWAAKFPLFVQLVAVVRFHAGSVSRRGSLLAHAKRSRDF